MLGLHPNVFFLGIVSLLTDMSSEMIFTLLPLFLSNVLGAAPAVIGLVGGLSDSTDAVFRIFSGWLSDRVGKRKLLTLIGYGLSTVAKPFMYLAGSWGAVTAIRFADRTGKGIRSSPRDALLAASLAANERGKGFGLHRAMDTAGAVVGTGLAILLLSRLGARDPASFRTVFLWSLLPALAGVALLFFVREAKPDGRSLAKKLSLQWSALDRRLRAFLVVTFLFTLGNSSNMFLLRRAEEILGTHHALNPVVGTLWLYLAYNLVYSLVALPAGILSDRFGRKGLLVAGYLFYGLVYLGFALVKTPAALWWLFGAYGIYIGITEGVEKALVADVAPPHLRATMIGLHATLVGIGLFPASLLAGLLWQTFGAAAPFYFGGALGVAAAVGLALVI